MSLVSSGSDMVRTEGGAVGAIGAEAVWNGLEFLRMPVELAQECTGQILSLLSVTIWC